MRCTRPERAGDSGMVTAELAAVLPVLALLLAFALWAVSAVGAQVRCSDAAREAARAAARGDSAAQVQDAALAAAPAGATVSVVESADEVRVTVAAVTGPLDHRFASLTVSGTAAAAREPAGTP